VKIVRAFTILLNQMQSQVGKAFLILSKHYPFDISIEFGQS
jgi:hypothetical protein